MTGATIFMENIINPEYHFQTDNWIVTVIFSYSKNSILSYQDKKYLRRELNTLQQMNQESISTRMKIV